MKTTGRIRHGDVCAETGRVFWAYSGNNEYWVSPERFEAMRKLALAHKKKRYDANPEKFRALRKAFRQKHLSACLDKERAHDAVRRLRPERRASANAWRARAMNENVSFAAGARLRVRIANAISKYSNGAGKFYKLARLLGCSMEHFMAHIERGFCEGMSWGNRRLWHLDHIRPCCAFDLSKPEEQLACFHYSNLRPLWAKDNLTKNGKY